jgi:uncharacterized iron-regulated membrane protein
MAVTSGKKPSKALRTWHRRLALVLGLFIAFQGLTGVVSQYRFWLLGTVQTGYAAPPEGSRADPQQVLEVVARDLPDFSAAHVMYPAANAPGTAVMLMGGSGHAMTDMVTLDPYRGEVISTKPLSESAGWVGLANALHKWTIFGTSGKIILTLLGLGTIGFAALGLAIFWNTRKVRPASTLVRWHRWTGVLLGPVLLVTATAGTALNLFIWVEKSQDRLVTSVNRQQAMALTEPVIQTVDVGTAYRIALAEIGPHDLAAFSPAGAHARHHWFAFNSKQLKRTDVLVDPETGAIAGVKSAGLVSGGGGIRAWLFPLHSGYVLGPIGGAITALTGLSAMFFLISGLIMWRRNRKIRKGAR